MTDRLLPTAADIVACAHCYRRKASNGTCPICRTHAGTTVRAGQARQCLRCGCMFPPRCTCSRRRKTTTITVSRHTPTTTDQEGTAA